jgi:arylsulfatase/uncharacterized sulfatase
MRFSFFGAVLAAVALATPAAAQPPAPRPNIVVIVVDDAALMDFGAFGGEARTPHIDALARRGAMLTGYRSSPLCSPSRAMLLTGVDSHRAGVATIEEVLPPSQRNKPGYGLSLEPGVLTVAERLRRTGYRTLMAGKWHLGHEPRALPSAQGFDRSLALDASGADNWAARSYMPYYRTAPWFEDGRPATLPKAFYSSDLLVDRLTRYIDEDPPGQKPWFAYLAFQAVHIPVQAPKAYSDRYRGRFDGGWAALRAARAERARALGIIPADAPVAPLAADLRRWEALSAEERAIYARTMEVYSGMLESMDAAIGRLIAHVDRRGELANTLFVVTSDNGPEPSDPVHATGMSLWMAMNGYSWRLEGLGEPGSLAFIGREWASALSAPSQHYKFYAAEGGVRAPLVISGPGVAAGARLPALSFVTDITPTLLESAGAPSVLEGAKALDGRSLRPMLAGEVPAIHGPDDPIGLEVSGNAALYRGDYKIVRDMAPLGDGRWRLYNLAVDPGETRDLSAAEPERLQAMLADYKAYEARVGVAPLPPGYTMQKQLVGNALTRQLGFARGGLIAAGLALVAAVAFFVWRRRRRKGRL